MTRRFLIFPRSRPDITTRRQGRIWHLGTYAPGCRGFTGPNPSTSLDELPRSGVHVSASPGICCQRLRQITTSEGDLSSE